MYMRLGLGGWDCAGRRFDPLRADLVAGGPRWRSAVRRAIGRAHRARAGELGREGQWPESAGSGWRVRGDQHQVEVVLEIITEIRALAGDARDLDAGAGGRDGDRDDNEEREGQQEYENER
ncbi:MAG: hypothetical protein ACRDV9_00530 [Acidimicrobiia bacterium]